MCTLNTWKDILLPSIISLPNVSWWVIWHSNHSTRALLLSFHGSFLKSFSQIRWQQGKDSTFNKQENLLMAFTERNKSVLHQLWPLSSILTLSFPMTFWNVKLQSIFKIVHGPIYTFWLHCDIGNHSTLLIHNGTKQRSILTKPLN